MANINPGSWVLLEPIGLAIAMLLIVDLIARLGEPKTARRTPAERIVDPKPASELMDSVVRAKSLTARLDQ